MCTCVLMRSCSTSCLFLEQIILTFPCSFLRLHTISLPYFTISLLKGVLYGLKRQGKMDLKVKALTSMNSNDKKKANLFAAKKERIILPTYNDDLGGNKYHISEFLSQPSGIAAVLNTKAFQSFQSLDANTYRCELPKLQFLNFEAAPLLDLRVTSTDEDCLVEMLSCKFEGSEVVKEQNNHFSAFMRNHMTWGGAGAESFLEVDVNLNLTLEIYTQPFTMMPTSAVEGPGNIMMQALVDKLVPLLLQQTLQDYDEWVRKQSYTLKSF
ncbi:uncharacterized protein [Glycine max]|uniref:uncharacterized protein isoform X3 n=1 Tax=Glycine max TaxID=3847 RepID=UPI001B35785B|nr:uncharacterized protein LOC100793446 isoform X3 [Glycine max]